MEKSSFYKKGQEQKGVMQDVHNEKECVELGVLYRDIKYKSTFVYKYENNGHVFKIFLDETYGEGGFAVSIKTEKFNFTDLGGMNAFAYIVNLKKMLEIMKSHGVVIKKIIATHLGEHLSVKQIDVMKKYLVDMGMFTEMVNDMDPDLIKAAFIRISKSHKRISGEALNLKKHFNRMKKSLKYATDVFDNARDKRYKLFLLAARRALRGQGVKVVSDDKDKTFEIIFN